MRLELQHPSIIYKAIQCRAMGSLEPVPAVIWQEVGYILDRSPADHTAKQPHMLTFMYNLASPVNLKADATLYGKSSAGIGTFLL